MTEKEVDRERKREVRANKTGEKQVVDWDIDSLRKKEQRGSRTEEERKFENIKKKHMMREWRGGRSGKDHLLQNLSSKKGMRLLEDEERIKEFSRWSGGKSTEMCDWEFYMKESKNHSKILKKKKTRYCPNNQ